MIYNPKIILAFWRDCGLPPAIAEHKFCAERKWRFDFAFPNQGRIGRAATDESSQREDSHQNMSGGLAIEVQGAIFGTGKRCKTCHQTKAGGHTRGAALLKEHEKLRAAAILGWRVMPCTPQEIGTLKFAREIKQALGI